MIEIACRCDGLPAHSHLGEPVVRGGVWSMQPTGEIRVWVDWKAVARALMTEEGER